MNKDDIIRLAKNMWCNWTHGGGRLLRDAQGRINWCCGKCGRWSDNPVPHKQERLQTDAAIRARGETK